MFIRKWTSLYLGYINLTKGGTWHKKLGTNEKAGKPALITSLANKNVIYF